MLELKNIHKSFDQELFVDLSYCFENNNVYLIQGNNGTGKSVLLKMISGFSKPDAGNIYIDGKELYKDIDFIVDTGVTINGDDFISYLDGYENLKLLLNIQKKVPLSEIERYAKYFDLEIHGIEYKKYSQGMKQKLRLIQAFIENPKYLILDEPTNALDQKTIDQLYKLIKKFMEEKERMIIMITHSDDIIVSLATKVLKLEDKHLVEIS